jgi:hypothetical protein
VTDLDIFRQYVSDIEASSAFGKWRQANPGEYGKWASYRDALLSGGNPAPPTLGTAFGRSLVDAGRMAAPEAPPPPPPPPPPPSGRYLWGFSAHTLWIGLPTRRPRPDPGAYLDRLAATGARAARDDLYPGTTTAALDQMLSLCTARSLRLTLILAATNVPTLAAIHDWAKTAAGYAAAHYPGTLRSVEPFNEPNGNPGFTPASYAAFVSAAHDGAKEGDPAVEVWAGATAGCALTWTPQVLQAGPRYDAWSCHPYPAYGFFPDAAGMLRLDISSGWAEFPKLGPILSAGGYNGKAHATEGFNCPTGGVRGYPESVARDVFAASVATWRTWPRAGIPFAYTLQDDSTGDANEEANFGAGYRSDGAAKLAVEAMKAVQ